MAPGSNMAMIIPVVLAGGAGTRLWPLSRQLNPKQFLKLFGEKTMFQQTLLRLEGLNSASPIVVCSEEHRFLAAEQLRELEFKDASIILEPSPRNTAPAIALAALHSMKKDENPLLLVLPADHLIADPDSFRKAVLLALPEADKRRLVTFGIMPDRPETGYGYIRKGEQRGSNIWSVSSFTEKPDEDTARRYLEGGEYWWNGGMFLFHAGSYLEELRRHAPDIHNSCTKAMESASKDLDFLRVSKEAFETSSSLSIDYAVMEKTDIASVVPLDCGWNDVGSWDSLWEACEKNGDGNTIRGDVKAIEVKNSLLRAESRLLAAVGVEDLVVVETKDAVLVAHRDHVQKIRDLVEDIRSSGRHEHLNQREVFRPWGSYDSIEKGRRYQVKRITVKPGEKTSTQMHHHRAEHWVVVTGTAKVTIDGENFLLSENESTFIPVGKKHMLENPGKIPLELIEVQSGSYLGEDDIVRYEDRYGRCSEE
jgi:mannose-1-phosphate guanylyltransferase